MKGWGKAFRKKGENAENIGPQRKREGLMAGQKSNFNTLPVQLRFEGRVRTARVELKERGWFHRGHGQSRTFPQKRQKKVKKKEQTEFLPSWGGGDK